MELPAGIAAFLVSPYNPAAFGSLVAAIGLTLFQQGWRGVFALLKRGLDADFERIWLMAILLLPMVLFGGVERCFRSQLGRQSLIPLWCSIHLMRLLPFLSFS